MNKSLFKKSYLKDLCTKYNAFPKEELSQYYLIEENPVKAMLKAGNLDSGDIAVEVGPGFGALTFGLAHKAGNVIAFEIEKKLRPYWEEQKRKHDLNLDIIWGEGVKEFTDMNEDLPENYKFFSNLPYHITSHILKNVLEAKNKPERVVVMLQKEVAERICQAPGDMSLLSVSVQFYGNPEIVRDVSRQAFWPQPNVDSTILSVTEITHPEIDEEKFFRVVKAGFRHKRKQSRNNLSSEFNIDKEKLDKWIADACGEGNIRAQKLSVDDWIDLTNKLDQEIEL